MQFEMSENTAYRSAIAANTSLKVDKLISLYVTPGLTRRLLYLYQYLPGASADSWLRASVSFLLNGTSVGTGLPASIYQNSSGSLLPIDKPFQNFFPVGGVVTKDALIHSPSIVLPLQPTSLILHACEVLMECDQIIFSLEGIQTSSIAAYYAYFACRSENK